MYVLDRRPVPDVMSAGNRGTKDTFQVSKASVCCAGTTGTSSLLSASITLVLYMVDKQTGNLELEHVGVKRYLANT